MERKYLNRHDAGRILAKALNNYVDRKDVIVLALPRGGVPVAYEIAKSLHVPLDVFIVRKLGVPHHRELAMGAIAMGDVTVFNREIIKDLAISENAIQAVIAEEKEELKRREKAYRGNHVFPVVKDKVIILVDDGIATGATMRAAITAIKHFHPARIIIAVPVADKQLCEMMQAEVDLLICPLTPSYFQAVGAWYEDFTQTEDDEVYTLMKEARKFSPAK